MTDPPESERVLLWLADRSRHESGVDRCTRQRFLGYHFGPSGYGIARKASSIPLAAGLYLHEAEQHIAEWVRDHDQLPPDDVVREGIQKAIEKYKRVVALRGLAEIDQGENAQLLVTEQTTMISGLAWAFRLQFLPWLLAHSRILEAEREEIKILGCTCGLGDAGEIVDHELRGCDGIGYQSRPDFLTEYRQRPGVLAYWERKTTGAMGERFESEWETNVQFSAGALGVQRRLGVPIAEGWVIAYIKGRREGDTWNPDSGKREGTIRQQSNLCYGWRRAADPPIQQADWQIDYNYVDTDGKRRRLGASYSKAGIWLLAEDVPEALSLPGGVSEFWCKWMAPEQLGKNLGLVGPLQINQVILAEHAEEILHEENRWRAIVSELYEVWQAVYARGGWEGREELVWAEPEYQAALRRLAPRNFKGCRRYGRRYECWAKSICFEEEGWQDPLGSGKFILRRPHHTPELEQMAERGLVPPEGWAEDEEQEAY